MNSILHWAGGNHPHECGYPGHRRRRTFHLGYRSFGGPTLPYARSCYYDPQPFRSPGRCVEGCFVPMLSPPARHHFEQAERHFSEEYDRIEAALRAVLCSDAPAFVAAFDQLHPAPVCHVLLCPNPATNTRLSIYMAVI